MPAIFSQEESFLKLYFSPGSCSLAVHISLIEIGHPFTLVQVDLRAGLVQGEPYTQVNPKGAVPALQLDSGEIFTEGVALQIYLSELNPAANLIPKTGTERFRCLEWLTYISTELHKGFVPLWYPTTSEEVKSQTVEGLQKKFAWVNTQLKDKTYLLGTQYSAADGYLFTVMNWAHFLKVDISQHTHLLGLMERVKARPAVQKAMAAEHLKG